MKTKDFIALLQKEDPTGEGYIRIDGHPFAADRKPGYYDGPYTYTDENGNFVVSTQGYKIDIYTRGINDHVERLFDLNNNVDWDTVKNSIKFDVNGNKDREDSWLKSARREYDEWREIYDERERKKNEGK